LFDEWREVVSSELRDPDDGWRFYIRDDGVLTGSGLEGTFASALDRLESLLERSEASVAECRKNQEEEASERKGIEAAFSSAVTEATPPDLPEWFKLSIAPSPMRQPTPVISVEFGELWDYGDEVRAAFDAAGHPAYISKGWVVPELSPEEIPDFVRKLLPELKRIRARKDAESIAAQEDRQPMIDLLARRGYVRAPDTPERRRP